MAIIPRSFCNGPYYRPFREFLLARARIRHIHLFDSRDQAFRDDAVLQENVILRLERDGDPGPVTVSTSTDDRFADYVERQYDFERIVFPGDVEAFIHIPTGDATTEAEVPASCRAMLSGLGLELEVSTH